MARIMVIDDAIDLCLLMRLTLQADGHDVTTLNGGVEALRKLDDLDEIDMVILDIQMPIVDGWTVLEAIRTHPLHADVPVLMCTVKFSHEDLARAWSMGCDGYLNKPFDLNTLTATARSILAADAGERRRIRARELTAVMTAETTRGKGPQ